MIPAHRIRPVGQLRLDTTDDPAGRRRPPPGAWLTRWRRTRAPFGFVVEIAAELPMQMICILLGVPGTDRHWLFEAVEPGFDFRGSRKGDDAEAERRGCRIAIYTPTHWADRRYAKTADDMLSVVSNATIDDPDAFGAVRRRTALFFHLLFSALETPLAPLPAGCWRWPRT